MRGLPDDVTRDGALPLADLDALVIEGRFGRTEQALRRIEALIPSLATAAEPDTLLLALYGRAVLLHQLGSPALDAMAACDVLEQAGREHGRALWAAIGCACRARVRVDAGDIGGATGDLARADAELAAEDLSGPIGHRLLDTLAQVYARLRLHDRLDDIRNQIEHSIGGRGTVDKAVHWSGWSTELATRAMESVAGGAAEPDHAILGYAAKVAALVAELPEADVPASVRRGARGVRALSAAYRGRSSEALRLLGPDAFGTIADLPLVERQIVALAAMRAHALVGSLATARNLDDAAATPPANLPHLILEVCRTRERLWLETYAGGDVIPVLHRMSELLVRLGWRAMDLVADTARQNLKQQSLRVESRTDPLTGVGNRRALDEGMRQLLRYSSLPLALVLLDVDRFKEVNDRFSHVIGDEVLRRVAATVSLQLRAEDVLMRYGGDEFVVLLPGTGDEEANAVAGRMAAAVAARPWRELADGLDVTVSTGCAAVWSLTGRRPDADAEKLFRRADERLIAAKRRHGMTESAPEPAPEPEAADPPAPIRPGPAGGGTEPDRDPDPELGPDPRGGTGSGPPSPVQRARSRRAAGPPDQTAEQPVTPERRHDDLSRLPRHGAAPVRSPDPPPVPVPPPAPAPPPPPSPELFAPAARAPSPTSPDLAGAGAPRGMRPPTPAPSLFEPRSPAPRRPAPGQPGDNQSGDDQSVEGKPGRGQPGNGPPGRSQPGQGHAGQSQPGQGYPGQSRLGSQLPGRSHVAAAGPASSADRTVPIPASSGFPTAPETGLIPAVPAWEESSPPNPAGDELRRPRREPEPPTSRTAIIDLSARKRPRNNPRS